MCISIFEILSKLVISYVMNYKGGEHFVKRAKAITKRVESIYGTFFR
jgi:hypothetical protein